MEKIIAYDFMGVIDIKNSFNVREPNLSDRIRKQVDLDKAFMLFQLARDTNAKLVSISTFAAYVSINRLVMGKLQRSENPEHAELANYLNNNRREAKQMFLNASFDSKQGVINDMRERFPDAKIVAFEDEVSLSDCEFIFVGHGGLSEKHIEQAKLFLED